MRAPTRLIVLLVGLVSLVCAGVGLAVPASAAPAAFLKISDEKVPVPSGFTTATWDCLCSGPVRIQRYDIDTTFTDDVLTDAAPEGDRVAVSGFEVGHRYRLYLVDQSGSVRYARSGVIEGVEGARRHLVDNLLTAPVVDAHGLSADVAVRTARPALVEIRVGTLPVFSTPTGAELTASGIVSTDYSRAQVPDYATVMRGLLPATHYFWAVRATDATLGTQTLWGEFTTRRRTVDVTFDRVHIDDDSDELSDGELEFGYWVHGTFVAIDPRRDLGTGGDLITGRRLLWTDTRPPTNDPMIVSVYGHDDDDGLLTPAICLYALASSSLSAFPVGESFGSSVCHDDAQVNAAMVLVPEFRTGPEDQDRTGQARTTQGSLKFTAFLSYHVRYV